MNGLSERSVATVKDHTRTMLLAADVPDHIGWMRAAAHHVYLWNRTHVCAATGVTPYENATGREPSILNVGVFGCDAFVHQDRSKRSSTFSPKAEPGIYLGHDAQLNCSVVRMLHTGKAVRAKDVIFRESSFAHMRAERERRAEEVKAMDLADLSTEPQPARDQSKNNRSDQRRDPVGSEDNDDSDADEDPAPDQSDSKKYTVKAIRSHRTAKDGSTEYEVKWVGHSAATWEPAGNMQEDAPKAVENYERFLENRTSARTTRASSRAESAASSAKKTTEASAKTAAVPSVAGGDDSSDDEEKQNPTVAARDVAAQRL